jgi:hypothetical protein
VNYDTAKPAQVFIIPNALIALLPGLKSAVDAYEEDRRIPLKYLDAHYNRGMVIRSFRETVQEHASARAERKGST